MYKTQNRSTHFDFLGYQGPHSVLPSNEHDLMIMEDILEGKRKHKLSKEFGRDEVGVYEMLTVGEFQTRKLKPRA